MYDCFAELVLFYFFKEFPLSGNGQIFTHTSGSQLEILVPKLLNPNSDFQFYRNLYFIWLSLKDKAIIISALKCN